MSLAVSRIGESVWIENVAEHCWKMPWRPALWLMACRCYKAAIVCSSLLCFGDTSRKSDRSRKLGSRSQ